MQGEALDELLNDGDLDFNNFDWVRRNKQHRS
jgi:hypothetical protein